MMSLMYIAGYVQKKKTNGESEDDTYFYSHEYEIYLKNLDRNGLTYLTDRMVQWVVFRFVFFKNITDKVCRRFLISNFSLIAVKHKLHAAIVHRRVLTNIFFKYTAAFISP